VSTSTPEPPPLAVRGGSALLPDGTTIDADVRCAGHTIDAIDAIESQAAPAEVEIDATGALVLPGLIDLHGDGFERTLMPRAGVQLGVAPALEETRSQLLAAGITTAFVSVTDGWEPGLRSRSTLRALVTELADPAGRQAAPRLHLHVRHERCNTAHFDELVGWVRDGSIDMLSYNDHTPGGIADIGELSDLQVKRSGVSREELDDCREAAVARRADGAEQERQLAEASSAAGIATASHDASSDDDLARDLALGVDIAEFPLSVELAGRYRAAGIAILLGAPNLVRGRSHLGNLSVRDAWDAGVADLICSDYHYQSLLHAPFALAERGTALVDAWHAVSRGPAEAVGLHDRGRIEPGALADLIVVEPPAAGRPARVRAVVVDGRLVAHTP
jgi:alpha-D-ribose 1-methylphosphonate 5-triphosphate diphosphatase